MPLTGSLAPGYRRVLVAGAVVCVVAALIGEFRFGSSLYLYTDVKAHPGAFQGSMSVVSAFLLVASAVLLWRAHEVLRCHGDRAARGFAGFSYLMAFLAFDELVMFHEWVADKLDSWSVWKPLGIDQDIYVFAIYGLLALLTGVRMLPAVLRHRDRTMVPLVLMVLLAFGSEVVDAIPWEPLSATAKTWLGPLEEGLKTMATLSAVICAHALLGAIEQHSPRTI